jgi:hypothetical protein
MTRAVNVFLQLRCAAPPTPWPCGHFATLGGDDVAPLAQDCEVAVSLPLTLTQVPL